METTPGGSAATPLLQVEGVTLAFGGVKALTGVGFDVQPGSITAVIGPNGAGKTSLFNTISGFYRPSSGSIRFQGQDITRILTPQRAKLGLGRSFQNIAPTAWCRHKSLTAPLPPSPSAWATARRSPTAP